MIAITETAQELLEKAIKAWESKETVLEFKPTSGVELEIEPKVSETKPRIDIDSKIFGPNHHKNALHLAKKQLETEWATMKPAPQTEENKRDYHIIRNRHVLDPKRHYKRIDKPSVFSIGTVVGGSDERQSIKKKQTIVDELLSDMKTRQYLKKRTFEVDKKRNNVTRKGYKKKKQSAK